MPRLDLGASQPLREVHHVGEGRLEREDGLPNLALAGLDLLGDRDFLLAAEEGDTAHLLEVHADGVGGFARRAFGLLRLGRLLDPLRLGGFLRLLGKRRVLDRVDLDVHVTEHRDDLIEVLGRGRFGGWFAGRRCGLGRGHRRHPCPRRMRRLGSYLFLLDALFDPLHTDALNRRHDVTARPEFMIDGLTSGSRRRSVR